MEMDFDRFREAASAGSASGGSNASETVSGGLSNLESALDEIQRAKDMERRLQKEVGPSFSDQVLKLAQDPKIQRAAREVWYGPEGAEPPASAASSAGPNGGPDRPDRAEATPEVTPEVTEPAESAVTRFDVDPIQGDGSDVTDYQEVERIATGQGVVRFGVAATETGPDRVTVTDGDEIIQYPAPEFMEWAEREGLYDPSEYSEKRIKELRQKLRESIEEKFDNKKEQVLFTLALNEHVGESSVFDTQKEIAEFLDTSDNYVRKVKSKYRDHITFIFDYGERTEEVTL
jgi:predicted secreted protein